MDSFVSSDLKSILHSKRSNIYYLEHCRILVNGGRVEYVTEESNKYLYWNIPIANSVCVLMGTGTSVTQAAMREFSKAGVLVGFCGGGGTPLYSGVEQEIEIAWFQPQSEYRPTEYLQKWIKIWDSENKRLNAAKFFQKKRIQFIEKNWNWLTKQKDIKFKLDNLSLEKDLNFFNSQLELCHTSNDILIQEALLTKKLYQFACFSVNYGEFSREKNGIGIDSANKFLDQGNYLAYGLAATATWVLGIPHAFSVLHGKTRRGALVFDVADLIKDALVLPLAFISSMQGDEAQIFRNKCLQSFLHKEALDFMIDCIKNCIEVESNK